MSLVLRVSCLLGYGRRIVKAPTSASMISAEVRLNLGGAGIYCIIQSDCKSLALVLQFVHKGFVLLSEVSIVYYGKSMALVIMMAHGCTSVLMFYFIGLGGSVLSMLIRFELSRPGGYLFFGSGQVLLFEVIMCIQLV
ncbi:hypothetical protein X798_04407 [Onchocerca flexuosa]|uniref:Uncharacterized protein n=1 Tax=Onchocerca flexuosa TaxID=387005 RepID=A0A238BUD8_9BILA|nr:hypothetical protein X798_04407 [Onchocerca flexuosa]